FPQIPEPQALLEVPLSLRKPPRVGGNATRPDKTSRKRRQRRRTQTAGVRSTGSRSPAEFPHRYTSYFFSANHARTSSSNRSNGSAPFLSTMSWYSRTSNLG